MKFIDSLVTAFGVKSKYALYRDDLNTDNFIGKKDIDWTDVVNESYVDSIRSSLRDARVFAPVATKGKSDFVLLTEPRFSTPINDLIKFHHTKTLVATKGRYSSPAAETFLDTSYYNAAAQLAALKN